MDSDHLYYYQYFSTTNVLVVTLFVFNLLLYYVILLWRPTKSTIKMRNKSSRNQAPEPAGSWPLVGHLHLLGEPNPLHIALGAMADKYGPAFTIRLGLHRALVVSSWEVAKEIFTTNDKVFASRLPVVAAKHMGYNFPMFGFASYGPYWREIRKIMNQDLLSNRRLELLKHVWDSEINSSIKELYNNKLKEGRRLPVLVEMKGLLTELMINISFRIIAGKRCFGGGASACDDEGDAAKRCQKGMRDFVRLMGRFMLSDAIPFLGLLDLGGYEKQMKRTGRELDCLLSGWLEEHKRKRSFSGEGKNSWEEDFMDVLLSAKLSGYNDADTITKATCLTLMGGSITPMFTLVWALASLVNNQHVLKKAHDELDIHVGRDRQVDESDVKNLVYLQAIVKETLRLYPSGSIFLGFHVSTEDCTVAGYHVPAGTRLIVNTSKIQRDPRVWSDPTEFKPERFLTSSHRDKDFKGQNFGFIPFGSGRRSCPGTSLALQVVHLALARMIHGFEFKAPSDTPIDMAATSGLMNIVKATPLEVLVTPRLSCEELYTHLNAIILMFVIILPISISLFSKALWFRSSHMLQMITAGKTSKINFARFDAYFFSTPTMVIIGGALFVVLLLYFIIHTWRPTKSKLKQPPEPAGAWPIIGHLRQLLGGRVLPHVTLGAMADKYGPVFTIQIGVHKALVVSSWEVAKECFTTNDMVFSSRPRQVAIKHMAYDYAMFGFAPYGHYWSEVRKIVNQDVLSHSRMESLQHVWGSEINKSIKELYELYSNKIKEKGGTDGRVLVEMKGWFWDLTHNVSLKMAAGKRYFGSASSTMSISNNEGDDNVEAVRNQQTTLREFFRLVGSFVPSDALPMLGWLDLGGYEKEMKKVAREMDVLVQGWLEERKRKILSSSNKKGGEQADWMDVMLSILDEDAKLSDYYDADTINKATCVALIVGGTDTNMAILVWAITLLMNNRHALKNVHDELDIHVGRDRQVYESDVKNLTYLEAVVKETLRLYSGPLSGFRKSTEDCTVAGYQVPAGTFLIVNTWKIHRDPRVWSDPMEFQPERFLTEHMDMDVGGQNFEFIPFGAGMRICPGASFSIQLLRLILARLIHGFEFDTPSDAPMDMSESVGLTNVKTTPVEVLVTPRLPSELYV
ncbi:Cytochrome P450 [Macleaya cordata]|uniref:Cytochrome P450 n=1 Tax=Macleaya cordata TaxID=56857 RepID=A0A200QK81_MACCD|nr:Cytochrome P450 [Macleaya cordata]